MRDDFLGIGILERLALAEKLPFFDAGIRNVGNVNRVTAANHDAIFRRCHDLGEFVMCARLDDQGLGNERFDGARGDARDNLLNHLAMHLGLQPGVVGLGNFQARFATRHVEQDDIARIDEMRVLDLGLVHAPDFRPAPRLLKEFAGNTPQGVTGNHNVPIRRIVDKPERFGGKHEGGRYGQDERGYNANHSRNLTCGRNAL